VRQYTVLLIPDPEEGGYTVRVPALPGLNTEGDTLEEALANAREAVELYLEVLRERGEQIPEEKERVQTVTITVAA
jgi:predicted RNase H-like HicB family nuclease